MGTQLLCHSGVENVQSLSSECSLSDGSDQVSQMPHPVNKKNKSINRFLVHSKK